MIIQGDKLIIKRLLLLSNWGHEELGEGQLMQIRGFLKVWIDAGVRYNVPSGTTGINIGKFAGGLIDDEGVVSQFA